MKHPHPNDHALIAMLALTAVAVALVWTLEKLCR